MNIREEFEKENDLKVEVTHNIYAKTVTVVNPEYVKWLEKQILKERSK